LPQEPPRAPERRQAAFAPPKPQAPGKNDLTPATISLDRKTEEVLVAVGAAGRFARPKVDANRSATIRLAVAMLAKQLSPEEIVAELRQRAQPSAATGRKRL